MSGSPLEEDKQPHSEWNSCPRGRFLDLSRRLKQRRNRREFLRVAGAGTAVGVLALGGFVVWHNLNSQGLSCQQVRSLAIRFQNDQLEEETREQILQHLAHCPQCQSSYQKMGIRIPS